MQRQYDDHSHHFARARAHAIRSPHHEHHATVTVAYFLASAILVLWMAYLSSVTGTILSGLHILPSHLVWSDGVNRQLKADKLLLNTVTFNERWNALGIPTTHDAGPPAAKTTPNPCGPAISIAFGCDA